MKTYLVLTIIGEDKPGIVGSLAKIIADHSGSWLESSMSQLAGKFAGILRVSVDENQSEALVNSLKGLSDELRLIIERVSYDEIDAKHQIIELSLLGNDRPGIIKEISKTVTELSVNFEQLNTECMPAPMAGDILFKASASLKVPDGLSIDVLQQALENLADDLIVEIKLV
jgi:glycine cleavage system regulatory protein